MYSDNENRHCFWAGGIISILDAKCDRLVVKIIELLCFVEIQW